MPYIYKLGNQYDVPGFPIIHSPRLVCILKLIYEANNDANRYLGPRIDQGRQLYCQFISVRLIENSHVRKQILTDN